ncbi:hypothetical protein BO71DRAFT_18626 [Aspergillus ellipticus CBS 707.79]|uniref:C2H2-type domain-containing protein n=1 Tax=Aspergillus ellipticus CBS 707.79 TaxID=1448320 RepID=A0A319DN56_9EURO|nr:hypothetical protein BO71DRAFT_18626 [Aspergillus ellipticus CBS 707.79]
MQDPIVEDFNLGINQRNLVHRHMMNPQCPVTTATASPNPSRRRNGVSEKTLQCGWVGCSYKRPFNRPADLMRHVKYTHISRQTFECRDCGHSFNRKDNLREHQLRRHFAPYGDFLGIDDLFGRG